MTDQHEILKAGIFRRVFHRLVPTKVVENPGPGDCFCGGKHPEWHFHHPRLCTDDAQLAARVWDAPGFDFSEVVNYPDPEGETDDE